MNSEELLKRMKWILNEPYKTMKSREPDEIDGINLILFLAIIVTAILFYITKK